MVYIVTILFWLACVECCYRRFSTIIMRGEVLSRNTILALMNMLLTNEDAMFTQSVQYVIPYCI